MCIYKSHNAQKFYNIPCLMGKWDTSEWFKQCLMFKTKKSQTKMHAMINNLSC